MSDRNQPDHAARAKDHLKGLLSTQSDRLAQGVVAEFEKMVDQKIERLKQDLQTGPTLAH